MRNFLALLLLTGSLASCSSKSESYQFQVTDLEPNLITLSSDEFMGRMPFTEGEKLTTSFLESKFKEMGLEPGGGKPEELAALVAKDIPRLSEVVKRSGAKVD